MEAPPSEAKRSAPRKAIEATLASYVPGASATAGGGHARRGARTACRSYRVGGDKLGGARTARDPRRYGISWEPIFVQLYIPLY